MITLTEARETARQWSLLVKQGIDPAELERQAKADQEQRHANTFGAVAEDWFRDKLAGERKGVEVERDVRGQFAALWGKPIADVTEADVLAPIRSKKRTAPSQARNLLGHAKRLFSWTIDQRCYGLTKSPCEALRPGKIIGDKRAGSRILSDDELFALWRAAGRLPYPHGPVYRLLVLNALRLNEVADASKYELDRRAGVWTIPAERMKGKNGKARPHAVPLTAETLEIFDSLPAFKRERESKPSKEAQERPFLFSTNFGKSPAWMTDKVKKRIDRRMLRTLRAMARRRGDDVDDVTLPSWVNHDIRRTVRSQLSRLKVTEEAREAVLAHARPGIKGVYDHHDYLDEKREALELWAARLKQIMSPTLTDNVVKFHATA